MQGELRDNEETALNVGNRQIELPISIIEYAKPGDFVRRIVNVDVRVVFVHACQNQQTMTNTADETIIHCYRRFRNALDHYTQSRTPFR